MGGRREGEGRGDDWVGRWLYDWSLRGDCLVAGEGAGKAWAALERVLAGESAVGAKVPHLLVGRSGHGGGEEGRLVDEDGFALFVDEGDDLGNVSQCFIDFLLTVDLILDLLFLPHA